MFCIRVLPLFYMLLVFTRLHFFLSFMIFTFLFSCSHGFYLFYRLYRLHFSLTWLFCLHVYSCFMFILFTCLFVFTFNYLFMFYFLHSYLFTLVPLFVVVCIFTLFTFVYPRLLLFFCTFLPFLNWLFV